MFDHEADCNRYSEYRKLRRGSSHHLLQRRAAVSTSGTTGANALRV